MAQAVPQVSLYRATTTAMQTRRLNNIALSTVTTDDPPPPVVVSSADLFGVDHELRILHNGEVYRLDVTTDGELILEKLTGPSAVMASIPPPHFTPPAS